MSQGYPKQSEAAPCDAITQRCKVLRMACWHMYAETRELIDPQDTGAGGQWLRTATVRDKVGALAERWLKDNDPKPELIHPGCWALPTLKYENRRVKAVVIGVTFEAELYADPWFTSVCGDAGADPSEVRRDLSDYTGPGKADLPLLAAALHQAVQDQQQNSQDSRAIDEFSGQLLDTYEEINLLFRLARMMNSLDEPGDLIPTCCHQILPVMQFEWIAVKFWAHHRQIKGITGRLILAGELPCETDVFERTIVEQLSSHTQGDWTRLLEPGYGGAADLVKSEVLVEQITHDGEVVGVLMAGNKRGDCPMESDITSGEMMFLEATSNLMGVFHENIARFDEQKQLFMGTLQALTASIDAKDEYTRGHSERVAYLGALLAEAMGMDDQAVELVHTTGLVHDVGKIGVPEAVLCKAGKLTDDEFAQIKRHPEIGHNILKGIPSIDAVLPGVLHHHERWDGRGYPHNLAGENIPQIGRLLALADTFDAMSSTRSYRPAMPREAVIEEITRCAGTQFDPALVPLFVQLDFEGYDRLVAKHGAAARSASAA